MANAKEEYITVENVNVPGRTTRVDAKMYEAMKEAMLEGLPAESPGLTQTQIRQAVVHHLPQELYPGGAKTGWCPRRCSLTSRPRKF